MPVLSLFLYSCAVQEMVQLPLILRFPTPINPMKIISPRYGQRSASQVILASVKLTMNINHHDVLRDEL